MLNWTTRHVRDVADGVRTAVPNSHVRGLANDWLWQQAEIERLTVLYCKFVPRPERMSGYSDPDCPDEYKPAIRLACEFHGVAVPEHLRAEKEKP